MSDGLESLFDSDFCIDKPIRLIELFGGIGSQAMALRDIGANFEHYRLVEFDKYACASYNAIHGTSFEPTDIRNVHGGDLGIVDKDDWCYLLTYSFPCFTGDTLVLTKEGLKQIKDVVIGDSVLTHANKYENVLASKKTGTKNIFRIDGMGIDEIKCTENHLFYVRKMTRHYPTYENGRRRRERVFESPTWVECKNLTKNHYLGVAINQNSIIPEWNGIDFEWADGRKTRHKNELSKLMSNHSFWWIIGRYLGDGWVRSQGGIIICCAKSETTEILPHLRNCGFSYSISAERTVNKIHIPIKELSKFVEPFGHGAYQKHIPGFVFDMPENLLQSLIDGYVSADGYVKNNLYKVSSISRELIYGMASLVAKAYKTPYRIYKDSRKPTCIIEGRLCNQKSGYELVFKTEKKKQDKAFYENGYIWFPIRSVENTNIAEDVYDIEVENMHSFSANGVIAHNCTDLSVAGKMKGMSKTDWESGKSTRSGLLWEVERILKELPKECLPDILLMENVPQVHAEKNLSDFESWQSFLRGCGYQNFYADLNARDFGIPQNRVRCFMVSILSDEYVDFEFSAPIELDTVMKDFLEDSVDERYYINNDKSKELIEKLIAAGVLRDGGCRMSELKVKEIGNLNPTFESQGRVYDKNELCPTLRTFQGGGLQPKVIEETKCVAGLSDSVWGGKQYHQQDRGYKGDIALAEPANIPGGSYKYIVAMRGRGESNEQQLEPNTQGVVNALTTVQKDNLVMESKIQKVGQISSEGSQCGTVVSDEGLSPTLSAGTHGYANPHVCTQYRIRKLTPRECWRLMGYTDEDFDKAAAVNSNTQLYKEAGNAIVKQVLMAIFRQMKPKMRCE